MQSKFDVRSIRNVSKFIEKILTKEILQGTTVSQSGSRVSRYQQTLRSSENQIQQSNNNRMMLPTNLMPQITTNFLQKPSMGGNNSTFDPSIRTKSASTMPRQPTGLFS